MKTLHILHANPIAPSAGGTERYVAAIAAAQGDPVFAVDGEAQPGGPPLRAVDAPFPLWLAAPPAEGVRSFRETWSAPWMEAALEEVLQRCAPRRGHIHHLAHVGAGWVERISQQLPLAYTLHDYHALCARGQLLDRALQPCPGPSEAGCARCLAEHLRVTPGMLRLGALAGRMGVRARARDWVATPAPGAGLRQRVQDRALAFQRALSAAALLLSPSQHLAERFERSGMVEPGRIRVCSLPLVSPLRPAPSPEGPFHILFVGSLIPSKGPDLLLEAFRRLPAGARLSFWGPVTEFDGQPGWGERLLRAIEACPGAAWRGCFGDDQRQDIYSEADLLVLPSVWEENSPLVVREGLATGLRVIAAETGGLPELLPRQQLFKAASVSALQRALERELRTGRRRMPSQDFSLERHLEELEGCWASL